MFTPSLEKGNPPNKFLSKQINDDAGLTVTGRESLVKARIGQGEYRDSFIKKYHGQCIITRLNLPEILIASHIKPWAASNNRERISSDNGLLLSATYDRLFDQGLISFENNGHILLSSIITRENADILALDRSKKYDICSIQIWLISSIIIGK